MTLTTEQKIEIFKNFQFDKNTKTVSEQCKGISNKIDKEELLKCKTADDLDEYLNDAIECYSELYHFNPFNNPEDYLKQEDPEHFESAGLMDDANLWDDDDDINVENMAKLLFQKRVTKELKEYKENLFYELGIELNLF